MLGRLRMRVDEAMSHYDRVGNEVFAHPRPVTMGGILRPRFQSHYMEKALQRITQEYALIERSSFNERSSGNAAAPPAEPLTEHELKRRAKSVCLREFKHEAPRT